MNRSIITEQDRLGLRLPFLSLYLKDLIWVNKSSFRSRVQSEGTFRGEGGIGDRVTKTNSQLKDLKLERSYTFA